MPCQKCQPSCLMTHTVDAASQTPSTVTPYIVAACRHIADPRRRCFHPGRLWTAIHPAARPGSGSRDCSGAASQGEDDSTGSGSRKSEVVPPLPRCLRSKGFFRLAHEPRRRWQWSTAGEIQNVHDAHALYWLMLSKSRLLGSRLGIYASCCPAAAGPSNVNVSLSADGCAMVRRHEHATRQHVVKTEIAAGSGACLLPCRKRPVL